MPQPLRRAGGSAYSPREMVRILRLAARAPRDPGPFCREVAGGTARYLRSRGVRLEGVRVLDAGTGFGALAEALARAGARVVAVDLRRTPNVGGGPFVRGTVERLPFRDGCFGGVVSSNVLEHVRDPWAMLDELGRVCAPGGFVYVSWTNWLSPIGGHELSPFHYLGPRVGLRAYRLVRRRDPPWNTPGRNLFPVHVGRVLKALRASGLRIRDVAPRYWPWARAIARVPGVREVCMWNCVILLEKPGGIGADGTGSSLRPWSDGSGRAPPGGTGAAT